MTTSSPAASVVFDQFVRSRLEGGRLFAVLYEQHGTSFVEDLLSADRSPPDDVRVLAAGQRLRSAREAVSGDPASTSVVGTVERVDDVAAVERELERTLQGWHRRAGPAVAYFDSLTPLLRAVDPPVVGDLLDRVTTTLDRWDATGVFQVERAQHDERTLRGLRYRVDASLHQSGEGESVDWTVEDPGAAAWIDGSAGPDRPPLDVALELLRTPERRAVLSYLSIAGTASLEDLAGYLAERPDVTPSDPERLKVGLYQVHLPKLSRAGVVGDAESGDGVSLRPAGDALLPLLGVVDTWGRRWRPPGREQ